VHISSQKISQRFAQMERVELTKNTPDLLDIIDDKTD
jgi:DNA recombination protein RmuC